jgi:myo-inositol-1(or 4)-monophosphatase
VSELADFAQEATRAARAAGALIARGIGHVRSLPVEYKGRGDVVTDIDRAAEAVIIELIRAAFPAHRILAEESGASAGAAESDYRWLVDPLDGSQNFVHGLPHCGVSIALTKGREILVGVVFDPFRHELYVATRDTPTLCNGDPVRVSGCGKLDEALLGVVFPKPSLGRLERFTPGVIRALAQAGGIRRSGSMVLDLAWVAAGRLDGFWQFGMAPWDIAAGALLVKKAGGHVAAFDGSPDLVNADSLLACTPLLAGPLRTLCAPAP